MINLRHVRASTVALVLLVMLLSGCAGPNSLVRTGPGINFNPEEVERFSAEQDRILKQLYMLAGLSSAPRATGDWDKVIKAGMDYADQKCEAYMHELFRLNRDKNTAIAQLGLIGTATAGILAAVKATAKDIAVTAIAFGLASSTVDNLSSNLLYELEPSSVRSLVKALQQGFRLGLPTGYDTRPAAVTVIRRYAVLCIPSNIEAEVNLAIKKSVPETKAGNASTGEPPEVTNAQNLVSATKEQISDAQRINRTVAELIKDKTKLAQINGVLSQVGAPRSNYTDFQEASRALDDAFRDMKPVETQKWMKALGI